MKYKYEEPLMQIITLCCEDTIRTSTVNGLQEIENDAEDVIDMTQW